MTLGVCRGPKGRLNDYTDRRIVKHSQLVFLLFLFASQTLSDCQTNRVGPMSKVKTWSLEFAGNVDVEMYRQ